jgi:hypothetical protein
LSERRALDQENAEFAARIHGVQANISKWEKELSVG